jgi:DNA-binding response OmpR family regulator
MQDFQVHWVKSGEEALKILAKKSFALAILDIMLAGIDGFEVAENIKKSNADLPFIFLSAKSLKIDKLKGFKVGAFDYITKPVDEELLVAKIKALIGHRNKDHISKESYQIGAYLFEPKLFKLSFENSSTKLTARETALLQMLCEHENKLLPRRKALDQIWGAHDEFSRKSMDVFISHLRKYLAKDDSVNIENIHGQGFILKC